MNQIKSKIYADQYISIHDDKDRHIQNEEHAHSNQSSENVTGYSLQSIAAVLDRSRHISESILDCLHDGVSKLNYIPTPISKGEKMIKKVFPKILKNLNDTKSVTTPNRNEYKEKPSKMLENYNRIYELFEVSKYSRSFITLNESSEISQSNREMDTESFENIDIEKDNLNHNADLKEFEIQEKQYSTIHIAVGEEIDSLDLTINSDGKVVYLPADNVPNKLATNIYPQSDHNLIATNHEEPRKTHSLNDALMLASHTHLGVYQLLKFRRGNPYLFFNNLITYSA